MHIARQRLAATFLTTKPWTTGREVVRALGAVQAQDYDGAKWALSMRTGGITDADIEREFSAGSILRTHVLRPTWHFVDPSDIRWMLALTGPNVARRMAPYDRHLGISPADVRRSNTALARALGNATHLTRAEIKDVLSRANVGTLHVQRTAHLLMRAELDAVICSGPRRGRHFTYALFDERVPPAAERNRDEALRDLTLRYFRTREPATAQDYSWWSGLTMTDVRRGIGLSGTELEPVRIDGKQYWTTGAIPVRRSSSTFLLPNYDEFFIGYRDRSAIGVRLSSTGVVTGGSALIANVVVIDGQLVGGWKRSAAGRRVRLRFNLLAKLSGPERSRVLAEVKRFEAFSGLSFELEGIDELVRTAPGQRKRTARIPGPTT